MSFSIAENATVVNIVSTRWSIIIGLRLADGRKAVYWASSDSFYTAGDGIASGLFVEGDEYEDWDEDINFETLSKVVDWNA